ncbi:MAG: TorF family putative porin [Pseudohongiellaceae bacterium]
MFKKFSALSFAALIVSVTSLASPGAAAQMQFSDNYLYPSLFIASDYRYQGISNSQLDPAVQASLYVWRPDGYYAGMWLSPVDFNDPGDTKVELDTYLGRNISFGKDQAYTLNGELMYSAFDDSVPGPTYDFWQAKLAVSREIGRLSAEVLTSWIPETPYGGGQAWRLEGDFRYRWNEWLQWRANAGHRWNEGGNGYGYASLGFILHQGRFEVELQYTETTLDYAECEYSDRCDAGLVGVLSYHFWR